MNSNAYQLARIERTTQEMERGRETIARHVRRETLDRWKKQRKILIHYIGSAAVQNRHNEIGVQVGENFFTEAYTQFPSEDLIAKVFFAVEFGGKDG